MSSKTVVVVKGDQTGRELRRPSGASSRCHRFEIDFQFFDLSLENRRKTKNQVVYEAAEAMKKAGFGLKAATITPEEKGDVGSPNAILRREIDGKVIVRTGRRIPGVRPVAGTYAPISVIRMAVGDAYGAEEWREGEGVEEVAFRTEKIDRKTCRAVAEFSFRHAKDDIKCSAVPNLPSAPSTKGCEGRNGRRQQAVSRSALRAAADRRHLRPAPEQLGRTDGDPGPQPGRGLLERFGPAVVRFHRRRRIDPAQLR